jgi:crotonobetaine/carnitine-CoA ligase
MPYFMIPLYIDIVDALPRTPTAKVEKCKLRKTGPGPATWNRHANGWELTRNGLVAPGAAPIAQRPVVLRD